ncbi:MAG TPA: head GIN domain-containing protein [Prolixibacteraceae bacterium]|nr:head GIN domain-containing protein [Prolixibacteraceae bacterium]
MYFLRITSLIFALGVFVSKLFADPVMPTQQAGDDPNLRTYNIQPFTKIYLEGAFKVVLEQGSQSGLKIRTNEDNFRYIDVQSDIETLSLKITKKHFSFDELVLYVTFKELQKLEIDGGVNLETKGYVDLKDFMLRVEGGATVEMNFKATRVDVVGEGGVKFEFDGIADELDARISGAGYLDAIDLKTRRCDIRIEGVGAGSVYSTESLNASISGVGKIRYKGEPKVFKKIEGVGVVSPE